MMVLLLVRLGEGESLVKLGETP